MRIQCFDVVQHYVVVLSTLWLTMTFCILRRRTIVKVSLDGVRVFRDRLFFASISPGNTSFVFHKVHASLHDRCFLLITLPGIEVTSRLFWSNSVGSAKTSYIFHSCNRFFLFPSRHCSQDIAVWKNFRSGPAILC